MRKTTGIAGLLLALGVACTTHAGVLASYEFTAGSFFDGANAIGVDALDVSSGPGGTLALNANSANLTESTGLADGTGDDMGGAYTNDMDYYVLTVNAEDGFALDLDSLSFDIWRGLRGCQDFAIYCSVDDYASQLTFQNDYITETSQPFTLDFATGVPALDFSGLTTVTFHIVIDDRADNTIYGASTSLDNLTLNGTAVAEEGVIIGIGQDLEAFPETALDITLNGFSQAGGTLTYAIAGGPMHGALDIRSIPNVVYTPATGYQGADSFTFTVSDAGAISDPATVTIVVSNEVPTAYAQSVTMYPGTSTNITLTGSDPDNGPVSNLTYIVETSPGNGALSGTAPALTYTPANGFQGVDSFTFSVFDGYATSTVATVSFNVTNEVPSAGSISVSTLANTPVEFTLIGTDPEGSDLTYTITGFPANGSLTTNGALPDLIYTPDSGYDGTDSITYTVSDGLAVSAATTVSITVLPDNVKTIVYNFEDADKIVDGAYGTASDYYTGADSNTLAGVTASAFILTDSRNQGTIGGIGSNTGVTGGTIGGSTRAGLSANAADANRLHAMSFSVDIAADVVADLTQISFQYGHHTVNDDNSLMWYLKVIEGTTTNEYSRGSVWNDTTAGYENDPVGRGSANLTGLTGLSDTTVTFIWGFSGQRGNHIYNQSNWMDDIVLSGTSSDLVPVISASVADGSMIMSWDNSLTYNVMSNVSLVVGEWGVVEADASSPVTLPIGNADQVFYRLSK
ncbi:Ig-like domain-containing protein [Pontiella sp.]|uniref:Ig-like domain-containing protein n=1 Tax=Pontiella sp. TaxID=2837462 RepID=UPI00356854BB